MKKRKERKTKVSLVQKPFLMEFELWLRNVLQLAWLFFDADLFESRTMLHLTGNFPIEGPK
jgi:hypothetical protein